MCIRDRYQAACKHAARFLGEQGYERESNGNAYGPFRQDARGPYAERRCRVTGIEGQKKLMI